MKYLITLVPGLLALAAVCAQPPAVSVEADYASFQALAKQTPAGTPREMGIEKYLTWVDGHRQQVKTAALAFYAAHPADPRRWEVVMTSVKTPPLFIQAFGPDVATKGSDAIIPDEAAAAAWREQGAELTRAMLASTDAPLAVREDAEWGMFGRDFRATAQAMANGEPHDFGGFRQRFDAHVAKYPDLDILARRAGDYLGALERNLPGASEEIWRHLQGSANAALRQRASERLAFFELMRKPLEMSFTAVDGRPVDLRALRGKVVLVDFWATWCGPCIAELPNIKQVYADYHDKGFEIVGIALENVGSTPKDTPEQVAAKTEAARKVLTDFTAKNDMPWPQYFDGKWWKSDPAVNYSINAIPAMFLLDQDGRVVSSNARGERLAAEVKRLLKL